MNEGAGGAEAPWRFFISRKKTICIVEKLTSLWYNKSASEQEIPVVNALYPLNDGTTAGGKE